MIQGIIAAVKIFGVAKSALALLLLAGSLLGIYLGWRAHIFKQGEDYAIAKIAANDARMVARAKKARGILQECQNSGRAFDQTTMRCAP